MAANLKGFDGSSIAQICHMKMVIIFHTTFGIVILGGYKPANNNGNK